MAGSVALRPSQHAEKLATAIREGWEVEFSRFFSYPILSSTSPHLLPLPPYLRNRRPLGTWITSMSPAWLQLINVRSHPSVILTVLLGGEMQEEHYVSRLNFAWPQASCFSGFPARGTRAVIVSYRDSVGEVQKFALRFSTICETEAFLSSIKDILNGASDVVPLNNEFGSTISSQSHFMSSNTPLPRAAEDVRVMTPVLAYSPELPTIAKIEAAQHSHFQERTPTAHNFGTNFAAFPPSFTQLLTSYTPNIGHATANSTSFEENEVKSLLVKYLEDSSFNDMLTKVDRVINELGGDLSL
ncbi:protein POOR HOMOLOGOUS SYNAPSIS 1 isoform X2 [Humulus lupulus]|uniref:protein POOR HOMOLOGOUS SYNAPSIS 1 isoform X2 n=1 Tax=Humulus lupulus TaxID=3486 RepID=UPI002B418165|nr:protein POOR HOMOLOGOUS SYNAPSIS 1 isoform X2 [Humulus lupulus]